MDEAVAAQHVWKAFESTSGPFGGRPKLTYALRDASLLVRRGGIHCLIGPNGAGKTTQLKLISTALVPTSGTIRILGLDAVRDAGKVRRLVSLVPSSERTFYYRLTGWENLYYFGGLCDLTKHEVIQRASPLTESLGLGPAMNTNYQTYSTGMRRKLAVVRSVIAEPSILLLDEPTSNLDPRSAEEVRRIIVALHKERGTTIVMSANNLSDVERMASDVSFIASGRVTSLASWRGEDSSTTTARFILHDEPAHVRQTLAVWPARPSSLLWTVSERVGQSVLRVELSRNEVTIGQLVDMLSQLGLVIERVELSRTNLEDEFYREREEGAQADCEKS